MTLELHAYIPMGLPFSTVTFFQLSHFFFEIHIRGYSSCSGFFVLLGYESITQYTACHGYVL